MDFSSLLIIDEQMLLLGECKQFIRVQKLACPDLFLEV